MKKPKIMYVNANNDEIGGADFCLLRMSQAIIEVGFEPIIVLRRVTKIVDIYKKLGIRVYVEPLLRVRATDKIPAQLGYIHQFFQTLTILTHLIYKLNIELVHTNDFIDGAGNLAARLTGVPSCQHIRVIPQQKNWLVDWLKLLTILANPEVICVSYAVRNSMFNNKLGGHVLYDWVDMQVTEQDNMNLSIHTLLQVPITTRFVGCVGRIEWWKGQHIFLEVAERILLKFPDVHFLVIGAPTPTKESYLSALEAVCQRKPYKGRITFLGFRMDMKNIMRQLDVMVHTSIYPEPFGMVIAEAMHCGTIVVGANAGGVPEQILDGINGFLYIPGNINDLENKLIMALEMPEPDRFRTNAQNHVRTYFNKANTINDLAAIYNSLLQKNVAQ